MQKINNLFILGLSIREAVAIAMFVFGVVYGLVTVPRLMESLTPLRRVELALTIVLVCSLMGVLTLMQSDSANGLTLDTYLQLVHGRGGVFNYFAFAGVGYVLIMMLIDLIPMLIRRCNE